ASLLPSGHDTLRYAEQEITELGCGDADLLASLPDLLRLEQPVLVAHRRDRRLLGKFPLFHRTPLVSAPVTTVKRPVDDCRHAAHADGDSLAGASVATAAVTVEMAIEERIRRHVGE